MTADGTSPDPALAQLQLARRLRARLEPAFPPGQPPDPLPWTALSQALVLVVPALLEQELARHAPGAAVQHVLVTDEAGHVARDLRTEIGDGERGGGLGLMKLLADVLLRDWEAPELGLRGGWSELLAELGAAEPANLPGWITQLPSRLQDVLAGPTGDPLRFRAELAAATVAAGDPADLRARMAGLLARHPGMQLRFVSPDGTHPTSWVRAEPGDDQGDPA